MRPRGFAAVGGLELPAGRFVEDEDGPLIWLSDDAPDPESVARLRMRHAETGLWPVVVCGDTFATYSYTRLSPAAGRLRARLEQPDADAWLADAWTKEIAENQAGDYRGPEEKVSALAPSGTAWPGLAPAAEPLAAPSAIADWHCAQILDDGWLRTPRLALMPGETSAQALAASWWTPPNTSPMTSRLSILRSWEHRFGARVVALKSDTLYLSVSAPPTTREHAVHVACEHLAFCPDIVWQCSMSFEEHVETILGAPSWGFWWD